MFSCTRGRVKFIATHPSLHRDLFGPRVFFLSFFLNWGGASLEKSRSQAISVVGREHGRGEGFPSLLIKAFRYSDLLPAW